VTGSRYSGPNRSDRWNAALPSWRPADPTAVPLTTNSPTTTEIAVRYEYEVRMPPPWSTVTVLRPATDPANEIVPEPMATTSLPSSAMMSTPQWPSYRPTGAKGARMTTSLGSAKPWQAPTDGIIETARMNGTNERNICPHRRCAGSVSHTWHRG
jgi:hypothetical protein